MSAAARAAATDARSRAPDQPHRRARGRGARRELGAQVPFAGQRDVHAGHARRGVDQVRESLLLHQPAEGDHQRRARRRAQARAHGVQVHARGVHPVDTVGHGPRALGPRAQPERAPAEVLAAGGDRSRLAQGAAGEDPRGEQRLGDEHVAAVQAHHQRDAVDAHQARHQRGVGDDPVDVRHVVAGLAKEVGHGPPQRERDQGREQKGARADAHVAAEALRVSPPAPAVEGSVTIRMEGHRLARRPAEIGMVGQHDVHAVPAGGDPAGDGLDERRDHVPGEPGVRGRHHEDVHYGVARLGSCLRRGRNPYRTRRRAKFRTAM